MGLETLQDVRYFLLEAQPPFPSFSVLFFMPFFSSPLGHLLVHPLFFVVFFDGELASSALALSLLSPVSQAALFTMAFLCE